MYPINPGTIFSALFVALTLFGALRFFRKRSQSEHEQVNWSPLEAIAITVGIYFVTQLLIGLVIAAYAGIFGVSQEQLSAQLDGSARNQFLLLLTIQASSIGLLYAFLKLRKTAWKAIGWIRPKWRDIGYALGGFGIYFVVYAVIIAQLVDRYLPIDTEQQQELGFNTSAVGPELIFIFLSLVILPPLVEEILVRGFLFTGLKNKFRFWPAAIITSIVFGAAHLQWGSDAPLLWSAAIDTFVLSMVLVYLRYKTGSLWPGIGVHFIKNGIAFMALFIFKVVS